LHNIQFFILDLKQIFKPLKLKPMLHYFISAVLLVVLIWTIFSIIKDLKQIHDDIWNGPPAH